MVNAAWKAVAVANTLPSIATASASLYLPPPILHSLDLFSQDGRPTIPVSIGGEDLRRYLTIDASSCITLINPNEPANLPPTTRIENAPIYVSSHDTNVSGHYASDRLDLVGSTAEDRISAPYARFAVATLVAEGLGHGRVGLADCRAPPGHDILAPHTIFAMRMPDVLTAEASPEASSPVGYLDVPHVPLSNKTDQKITWLPLRNIRGRSSYWNVPMDAVSINGSPLPTRERKCALVSDANVIVAPRAEALEIIRRLGGRPSDAPAPASDPARYLLPCNATDSTLTLNFGGKDLTIPYSLLISGKSTPSDVQSARNTGLDEWCESRISDYNSSSELSSPWFLGTPFLSAVYSLWDHGQKRIGLVSMEDYSPDFWSR